MIRQIFEYHPKIGYKYIPNLKTRIKHESGGYLINTNTDGFRCNHEFIIPKRQGKNRVLFFGDSFTAGDGVSNSRRFTDELERMIPNCEIFNYGLSGTGTDQQYLIYKTHGELIKTDLVVLVVLVENIRRVNAKYRKYVNEKGEFRYYQKPYYQINSECELVLTNQPVSPNGYRIEELTDSQKLDIDTGGRFGNYRWFSDFLGKLKVKKILQKFIKYQPFPEYNNRKSKEWYLMSSILKKWIGEIQKEGKKVLIVPLPLYYHIEEISSSKEYTKRFKELSIETNCLIHDVLPDLLKYSMDERRNFRFKFDTHFTHKGHNAVAESLFPIITSILNQPYIL